MRSGIVSGSRSGSWRGRRVSPAVLRETPYPLKILFAFRYDPLYSLADYHQTLRALEKLELIVSCDINFAAPHPWRMSFCRNHFFWNDPICCKWAPASNPPSTDASPVSSPDSIPYRCGGFYANWPSGWGPGSISPTIQSRISGTINCLIRASRFRTLIKKDLSL